MGRVTVAIPTIGRPDVLETTLRAVSRQTQLDLIEEVVVSENLGDRSTEAVCSLFPELPITYRFRDPVFAMPMASFKHAAALFAEARTEYVAFVCDDDVWSPGHVATAVDSLDRHPGAAAHFSAFYGAESELSLDAFQWGAGLLWLAAGRPARFSEYVYDEAAALALGWVFTPFQWSTLVARSKAAVAASPFMLDSPHAFFADRMLIMGLAEQGDIVFDPAVDTLYRYYDGNWVASQDPKFLRDLSAQGEDIIRTRAAEKGIDLPSLWREYLTDVPDEIGPEVRRWIIDRFSAADLKAFGMETLLPAGPSGGSVPTKVINRLRRAYAALAGKTG